MAGSLVTYTHIIYSNPRAVHVWIPLISVSLNQGDVFVYTIVEYKPCKYIYFFKGTQEIE